MSTEELQNDDVESENEESKAEASEKTDEAAKTPEELVVELEQQKAELQDQVLRKTADFDNYRKRMFKEKQEAYDYANANLLTDLITVLDDFDRAIAAGIDADGSPVQDLKPVVDGIGMINKQLHGLLEAKYNLSAYGENGDIFDHDKHEAIATNTGEVDESICSEVYLKGYMLKDRIIRPAKVMVTTPDTNASIDQNA